MKKILYISDISETFNLYQSQVVYHVRELRKYFEVHLIILDRDIKETVIDRDKKTIKYKSPSGDYVYLWAAINFSREYKKIAEYINHENFNLIYTRGLRGGLLGVLLNKKLKNPLPLVNDVRADNIDENKGNWLKKNLIQHANKKLYQKTDYIFTVSTFLKEKFCSLYNFDKTKAAVFPTFVLDGKFKFDEKIRNEIRAKLGYSNEDIVLLYSGNSAKHQNIDLILQAFSKTRNKSLKLLLLTRDERMETKIREANIDKSDVQSFSVEHKDIHKYYFAGDVGLLIRDNTDTNKSAAPTKFSEYVNAGLYLCINKIDSDYVKQFQQLNLRGSLLKNKEDLRLFFDEISYDGIERNDIQINNLSGLVEKQSQLINSLIN